MTTVEGVLALGIALAGLAQTLVNMGMKIRQDRIENNHDQMAQDLKDFAKQLQDCITGSSDKQVQ